MGKKMHIEVIRLVWTWDNHEHIHHLDVIEETDMTAKEILAQFSIEVYECEDNGVWKSGWDATYGTF